MVERNYHEHIDSAIESSESIGILNKGLGKIDRPFAPDEIVQLGWNLFREDLSLPAAVLYEERLANNLKWMQQFIAAYGLKLAPHGKTTMAPKLFARQLQTGAWGVTLATAQQTRVAYEHGVRRVLMANQLVGRQNMEIIAGLIEDRDFEYFCLVDSASLVEHLGAFFRARGFKLQVLIELGVDGGRAGVRNREQLDALLGALEKSRGSILLRGVELYEGVLDDEASIRAFLQRAVEITRELANANRFERQPVILSGAGSAWYDVVAEEFSKADPGQPIEIVLRPGCYLTHDVGVYRTAQQRIHQRNPIARQMQSGLQPALQLWAYVQSVPERNRAIIGLGKRDAAFDAGLPTPTAHFRPGSARPAAAPTSWELTKMMDQHAYLRIEDGDDVRVGDMIGFDISHPCLTFDKWRYLPVLDADYQVIDVVQTFF
ncbi:MAG TPA: amino acid deaminase [Candidatus Acidoferrum sp.]|jgi:D-serine dehydratase|nr:amino acid deaminase [Candidatus Acidoferrum sp.]